MNITETILQKQVVFNRSDTKAIKGIIVLLMPLHHLAAFSYRTPVGQVYHHQAQQLCEATIPQAVEDARDNARRNGIENAEFFCGDAGQAALDLEQKGIRPDVVVVDPPRKGLNADTIEALHRMKPRRIVYISCDPATLSRDVALLKDRGYELKNAMAADLFPRCSHVESIAVLQRKG